MTCIYGALGCVGYVALAIFGGATSSGPLWASIQAAYLAAIVLALTGAALALRDRTVGVRRRRFAVGVGVVLPTALIGLVALLLYALSHLSYG